MQAQTIMIKISQQKVSIAPPQVTGFLVGRQRQQPARYQPLKAFSSNGSFGRGGNIRGIMSNVGRGVTDRLANLDVGKTLAAMHQAGSPDK